MLKKNYQYSHKSYLGENFLVFSDYGLFRLDTATVGYNKLGVKSQQNEVIHGVKNNLMLVWYGLKN